MLPFVGVFPLLVVGAAIVAGVGAQSPAEAAVVVGSIDDVELEERLRAACATLRTAGKLVAAGVLLRQFDAQPPLARKDEPLRTAALSPPDLHDLVQPSTRLVVHYYLCKECDDWHVTAASGFCIDAAGAVATCAHVVAPDDGMRESFLVSADLRGNVWPVEQVLAVAAASDVCVLQTTERGGKPLPLRATVRTGERVWCLSHPDHQFGFFSEGMVARQYVLRAELPVSVPAAAGDKASAPQSPAKGKSQLGPPVAFLHVTCDFCKGSSGAPIVDAMGNVVGVAQSTTTVVYDETATPVDTQMVFKSATPAAALSALWRGAGATPK